MKYRFTIDIETTLPVAALAKEFNQAIDRVGTKIHMSAQPMSEIHRGRPPIYAMVMHRGEWYTYDQLMALTHQSHSNLHRALRSGVHTGKLNRKGDKYALA